MKEYKQIRLIMTEEKIAQVLEYLPEKFSSKQFEFFFLLCFPQEKAKIIANAAAKGKYDFETYLNRCFLPSLNRKGVLVCMKKGTIDDLRWTKDLSYKVFRIHIKKQK